MLHEQRVSAFPVLDDDNKVVPGRTGHPGGQTDVLPAGQAAPSRQ
jgi:hypothetical protein